MKIIFFALYLTNLIFPVPKKKKKIHIRESLSLTPSKREQTPPAE